MTNWKGLLRNRLLPDKVLFQNMPGGPQEIHKNSVTIAGIWAQI
jgi:hypothetical protein